MTKRGITPIMAQKIRAAKGIKDTKMQKLRLTKGMSQDDLAEASGVAARVIRTYEQGERDINNAKLKTLCKLCIALECDLSDILEDEETIELYKKLK